MFKVFQTKLKDVSQVVQGALTEDMTLDQVRQAMLQLLSEENVNHHRMGVLYNHVVKKGLAEAAGYTDAKDYFSKNLGEVSRASLTMYGSVADKFSEEVARSFSFTSLYLLLTYKELAGQKVDHDAPGDTPIDVPDEK